MSISAEEAAVIRENSQAAIKLATQASKDVEIVSNAIASAVEEMAKNTKATTDLNLTVEKVLTENSYTKSNLEKITGDVERHNMSEETLKAAVKNVDRMVKKEATYDKTSFNQAKTGWAIIGLFIMIIGTIIREFIK